MRARSDIDDFGYCLLGGALSPDEVAAIRARFLSKRKLKNSLVLRITATIKSN
jgi:hypothetical protein